MSDSQANVTDTLSKYPLVETVALEASSTFSHPEPLPIVTHLDDLALTVMLDFEHFPPSTIYPDELIDNALAHMRTAGEHLQFVIEKKTDIILGLISSADIQGVKPVKISQERRIRRQEVEVKMIMTKQKDTLTFDIENLRHTKVGSIVATLKHHKQHDALVVENCPDTQTQHVRGLFSLSKIGNMLGIDVASLVPETHTLSELQHIHS